MKPYIYKHYMTMCLLVMGMHMSIPLANLIFNLHDMIPGPWVSIVVTINIFFTWYGTHMAFKTMNGAYRWSFFTARS